MWPINQLLMITINEWKDVPAQDIPGLDGVTIRWLISKEHGAPNFCLRLFEIQPGCATPYHAHDWEHEMFILEGQGALNNGEGERVGPWTALLIPAGETHNIKNVGEDVLRLLCLVPNVEGAC